MTAFLPCSSRPRAQCLTALAGAVLLTGCQSLQSSDNLLRFVTPYRLEVVQGNVITKEQAAQVRPGMSRAQVRDVLGSPLLADIFHADRWDYVFTIRRQGAPVQARTVVVLFDGEALKSMEAGGELPAERDFVASIDTQPSKRNVPILSLTDEQRSALASPPRPTAAVAVPDGAARTYPALEPAGP